MSRRVDLLLALTLIAPIPSLAAAGDVQLTLHGKPAVAGDYQPAGVTDLTMRNGLLAITFGSDYSGGGGRLVADIIRVVKNTPEMAHIAVIDSGIASRFYLEHHILLRKGESGLYGYAICGNLKNQRLGGEMRTMYRLDRDVFDWAYVSERTGQQPRYADLVKLPAIQDETWKMPDGSIYQKYDYSGYMAENPVWGHYGHGFGVWFLP